MSDADARPLGSLLEHWREAAKRERADRWCNTEDAKWWRFVHEQRGAVYEKCADQLEAVVRLPKGSAQAVQGEATPRPIAPDAAGVCTSVPSAVSSNISSLTHQGGAVADRPSPAPLDVDPRDVQREKVHEQLAVLAENGHRPEVVKRWLIDQLAVNRAEVERRGEWLTALGIWRQKAEKAEAERDALRIALREAANRLRDVNEGMWPSDLVKRCHSVADTLGQVLTEPK